MKILFVECFHTCPSSDVSDWCTFSCSPAKLLIHLWKQILQELFLRRGDSSCVGGNKGHIWRKLSELFLKISETSSRCL